MKLVRLSANKSSFHTVTFRPSGVSLVVGMRTDKTQASRSKTYNGVGKSLMAYLIGFCLGAKPNKQLEHHLSEWVFSLEFEFDGQRHIAERACATQDTITLDGGWFLRASAAILWIAALRLLGSLTASVRGPWFQLSAME